MTRKMEKPNPTKPPKERADFRKFPMALTRTEAERLDALRGDTAMATFLKHLVNLHFEGRVVDVEAMGEYEKRPQFLAKAPCGPWAEAIAESDRFVLSGDVAQALEYQDGDVVVQAVGESMEGSGIFDGFLILMRPLKGRVPRRGEITLVQISNDEGLYSSTIKHWHPGTPPALTDGEGKPHSIPPDTTRIEPIAVARGMIGRL